MAPSRFYSNISVAGTLGAAISNSATSVWMTGNAPSGYPGQFPFTLVVDSGANLELLNVTAGAGTSSNPWIVTRGYDGTVAVAHAITVPLAHNLTAGDVSASRLHEALGSGSGAHGLPAAAWTAGSVAAIAETVLANSTTTVVTWSSIPQTYNHLLILVLARLTETSLQTDDILVQFNGDSGSNYSYLTMSATNTSGTLTTPGDFTASAVSGIIAFRVAASQAGTAANAGAAFGWVPWYTSTRFNKILLAMSGAGNGTSTMVDGRLRWGFYNPASQSAVTSVSLSAPSGSDFLTGSSFGLYGLT